METVDINIKQTAGASVLIGGKEVSALVRKAGAAIATSQRVGGMIKAQAKK